MQDPIVTDERRRQLLRAGLLGTLSLAAAGLVGCVTRPAALDGSFVQIWQSHLGWSRTQWRRLMAEMRALGCREVVLQWVGIHGGKDPDWQVPDDVMETIFDTAGSRGLDVRVGLPFDNGWWQALQAKDPGMLAAFLHRSRESAIAFLKSAPWPRWRRFGGWYIPYEIEQYSWADEARQAMLADWLSGIAQASTDITGQVPALSTYFSRLPTEGKLADVWRAILDRAPIRPMVQDGVGVAGMGNLRRIDPLLAFLRERGTPFDVVVELFEELPSPKGDGTDFRAQSATWERVQKQLEWARQSGADDIVAFAVEPWLTGEDERARELRRAWRRARF